MSIRVISFHHRLGGMLGHRFTEAFGLQRAVKHRGWDFILLVREDASVAVAETMWVCPV